MWQQIKEKWLNWKYKRILRKFKQQLVYFGLPPMSDEDILQWMNEFQKAWRNFSVSVIKASKKFKGTTK